MNQEQPTMWSVYGWCSDFKQKSIPAGVPLPGTVEAKEYFKHEGRYFAHYPGMNKVLAVATDSVPESVLIMLNNQPHPDKAHLEWIYQRLIHVHGENPNVDYMLRFRKIISLINFN